MGFFLTTCRKLKAPIYIRNVEKKKCSVFLKFSFWHMFFDWDIFNSCMSEVELNKVFIVELNSLNIIQLYCIILQDCFPYPHIGWNFAGLFSISTHWLEFFRTVPYPHICFFLSGVFSISTHWLEFCRTVPYPHIGWNFIEGETQKW